MNIKLIKGHGSGNEFYIIDEALNKLSLTEEDRGKIAICLCDKLSPLGADGILYVLEGKEADGRMRIFNSDGSEAEMCGNGLRLIGRYLMEKLGKDEVNIATMKALYQVKKVEDIGKGIYTVEVPVDTITFEPSALPLNYPEETMLFKMVPQLSEKYSFSAVSITNPHLVAITEEIRDSDLTEVGVEANFNKELLPKGTNVNFVKLLSEDSIFVRTYERGVGLTPSCGTGMIASSVITSLYNSEYKNKKLKVVNQGGMINCIVRGNLEDKFLVNFSGNATYIYSTTITYDSGAFELIEPKNSYFEEGEAYEAFLQEIRREYIS
ncbi:diaminopimelate epimerase [Alloiococcus sp. CFN-8]|uniref:diaminopimelate epimerase n=1 Tax=Alloiococcus sp. CFN-8 TaxID=3416081 RepID=UPI003CF2A357